MQNSISERRSFLEQKMKLRSAILIPLSIAFLRVLVPDISVAQQLPPYIEQPRDSTGVFAIWPNTGVPSHAPNQPAIHFAKKPSTPCEVGKRRLECITTAATKPSINSVKKDAKFIPIIVSLLCDTTQPCSGDLAQDLTIH